MESLPVAALIFEREGLMYDTPIRSKCDFGAACRSRDL